MLGERLRDCGFFEAATLQKLVDEHQSGLSDHGTALWMLVMFEAFLRVSDGGVAHG